MTQSDYITAATLRGGKPDDDFIDVIAGPASKRIEEALDSRYTRALFNGAVGVRSSFSPEFHCDRLLEAFSQTERDESWTVRIRGKIELTVSLNLVQMELVESLVHCQNTKSIDFLNGVLSGDDDTLHFAVFRGLHSTGRPCHEALVQEYLQRLPHLDVPDVSTPCLKAAATSFLSSPST